MRQKTKSVSSPTHKPYDTFFRSVRLIAMGLNGSIASVERGEYIRLRREKDGGQVKLSSQYHLDEVGPDYFEVKGNFKFSAQNPKSRKAVLEIVAEYGAHFHAKPPIDRELAEQFTHSDLRIILWPFFRQHVFDITGKMAVAPVTLPLTTDSESE
jgi:preprotein translocase subunit SecB